MTHIKTWQERGPHYEACDKTEAMQNEIDDLRAALMNPVTPGPKRIVVCAANRYGNRIFLGARHFDERMREVMQTYSVPDMRAALGEEQGFIDQHGVFMDRKEALAVATAAGQIGLHRPKNPGDWLCSEDLY